MFHQVVLVSALLLLLLTLPYLVECQGFGSCDQVPRGLHIREKDDGRVEISMRGLTLYTPIVVAGNSFDVVMVENTVVRVDDDDPAAVSILIPFEHLKLCNNTFIGGRIGLYQRDDNTYQDDAWRV